MSAKSFLDKAQRDVIECDLEAANKKIKELESQLVSRSLDQPFDATTEYHYQKRIAELEERLENKKALGNTYTFADAHYLLKMQNKIQSLESKLRIAVEALLRLQVRIGENESPHYQDITASKIIVDEALAQIKDDV